jgi:hypothetical protein
MSMGHHQAGSESISRTEDVIDSRDVIARIEYLKEAWDEAAEDNHEDYALSEDDWAVHLGEEDAHELVALMELAEYAEGYAADWIYGETLIHEAYFEDYAQQLAEDIGAIPRDAAWPLMHIDWEAAAEALLIDYTEVDYDGQTYYIR